MVQETSLLSWFDVQPVLGSRQAAVFALLKAGGPLSNMELAGVLGWSVNCVTPRVLELRKAGWVVSCGVRACRVTGRLVMVWGVL